MNINLRSVSLGAIVLALAAGLSACSNMSRQDKATAAGAALGGVAGSVLTDSAVGTVGGAVVGGVIGHEVEKKK